MSETFVCELCHQEHPLSDRRGFDGPGPVCLLLEQPHSPV